MYKVKIYKSEKRKAFFWYLHRCLYILAKRGIIKLEQMDNPPIDELYWEIIYINDYPVIVDVRDNITINKDFTKMFDDFVLLKSNFCSEIWNDEVSETFEYKLKDWELKMRDRIRPFIRGRPFNMPFDTNELIELKKFTQPIEYKVVSLFGAGLYKQQTLGRMKMLDFFDSIFENKAKLIYLDRRHFANRDEIRDKHEYYLKKYPCDKGSEAENKFYLQKYRDYGNYIKFISSGEFSINVPGLALSTPFRFIDSILADRCIISTKIYHDIYKTFPCVKLPVCGYFGNGDWDEAKKILQSIDSIDQKKMLQDAKNWYNHFLSAEGMWKNLILKALE